MCSACAKPDVRCARDVRLRRVMCLRAWVEHITSLCGIAAKHHGASRFTCLAGNFTLHFDDSLLYYKHGARTKPSTTGDKHDLPVKMGYKKAAIYMTASYIKMRKGERRNPIYRNAFQNCGQNRKAGGGDRSHKVCQTIRVPLKETVLHV